LLVAAVISVISRRRRGFLVGLVGALAGVASTAYQSAMMDGMETAYANYGVIAVACLLGRTEEL